MKKVINSSDIVIGKSYLLEESEEDSKRYFKNYPTIVKIEDFDGTHFWSNTFDQDNLAGLWDGYDRLCVGSPEADGYSFYEIEPTTTK